MIFFYSCSCCCCLDNGNSNAEDEDWTVFGNVVGCCCCCCSGVCVGCGEETVLASSFRRICAISIIELSNNLALFPCTTVLPSTYIGNLPVFVIKNSSFFVSAFIQRFRIACLREIRDAGPSSDKFTSVCKILDIICNFSWNILC